MDSIKEAEREKENQVILRKEKQEKKESK